MALTTCPLKQLLIESKLNGCFWVLLLHWDLEIFVGKVLLLHPCGVYSRGVCTCIIL